MICFCAGLGWPGGCKARCFSSSRACSLGSSGRLGQRRLPTARGDKSGDTTGDTALRRCAVDVTVRRAPFAHHRRDFTSSAATGAGRRQCFSLPEMLRRAGGELESWQPDRQGGTLQLEVNWAQFQSLFHYFHQHAPAVALPQFQLKREQDALRLQLSLVFNHER